MSRPLEQNLETESQKNFEAAIDRQASALGLSIGKQRAVVLSASAEDVTSAPAGESDHSGLSDKNGNGQSTATAPGDSAGAASQKGALPNGQQQQQPKARAPSVLPESFTCESYLHAATSSNRTLPRREPRKSSQSHERASEATATRVVDADARSGGRASRAARRARTQQAAAASDRRASGSDTSDSESDKPFWSHNLNLQLRGNPNAGGGVHPQCACARCLTASRLPLQSSSRSGVDPSREHAIYVPLALAAHYAQTGTSPITPLPTPADGPQYPQYPQYMNALMQRSFSQPHDDDDAGARNAAAGGGNQPVANTVLTSSLARPFVGNRNPAAAALAHRLPLFSLQQPPRPQSALGRSAVGDRQHQQQQQLMLSVVSPLGGAGGQPAGAPAVSPTGGVPGAGSVRTVKAPYTISSFV